VHISKTWITALRTFPQFHNVLVHNVAIIFARAVFVSVTVEHTAVLMRFAVLQERFLVVKAPPRAAEQAPITTTITVTVFVFVEIFFFWGHIQRRDRLRKLTA